MNERNEGPLLERLLRKRPPRRQKALRPSDDNGPIPMFKMLREPTDIREVDWKKHRRHAIWRENGSIICIRSHRFKPYWDRNVYFTLGQVGGSTMKGVIYGETDAAIAETATFLWSLKHEADMKTELRFSCKSEAKFDFASFQPGQLANILNSNPARLVELEAVLSAEQSKVLATRPYPLDLNLVGNSLAFLDNGKAFVEALEERQNSFGSLCIVCGTGTNKMCLSSANLERLLELEFVFEKLEICSPTAQCALLPFSAKVHALDYRVDAKHFQPESFSSLVIAAKDLTLCFDLEYNNDDWGALLISFLNRVAALGHFERLRLSIRCHQKEDDVPFAFDHVAPVAEALIGAIRGNPKLTCLDLSGTESHLYWGPHMQSIFGAIGEHKGLHTFVVQSYLQEEEDFDSQFKFDRSWLKLLLSCNRNIVVLDDSGKKCTDGSTINKAYALNDFLNGSVSLAKESMSLRPLLVGTTLTESASTNVQYTALLLSQHTGVLCGLIHHDDDLEEATLSASRPEGRNLTRASKRKKLIQSSRDAKKASLDEM